MSRVAGREGDSFISPADQRARIEAHATAGGHQIVAVHEDLDEPGSKYERPGFQAALARVEAGETDGIIVAKLDRFARSVHDAARAVERLETAGGTLVAVDLGMDTSTPGGRLMRNVLMSLAEFELDRIRDGWSSAQAHAVARGVHVASRVPTGYRRRDDGLLEPDPKAAPVIHELFRRRAAGDGWKALADFVDASGITGPYGNTSWAPGTLAKIIKNPVYLGEARSGAHVNETAHDPIVTRTEWEAAQGVRSGASARNGDGLLLAGLVRCSGCRYVVKPDTMKDRNGDRLGFYRCRRRHPAGKCPTPIGVLARVLDPYVERSFLDALGPDGPLAEASTSTAAIEEAVARMQDAERELAAYRDDTVVAVIGRDAFVAGLEKRVQTLDTARAELAAAREHSALARTLAATPGGLVDAWPTLTVAERRSILTAAIDAVFVRPSHGTGRHVPIEQRTLILWRGQAPKGLPRRGHRVPLGSFHWPDRPDEPRVAGAQDV